AVTASSIAPPTLVTSSASNIGSTAATLNGTVTPNGSPTGAYFEWGATATYGNITPSQTIGGGADNVGVTSNLTGLTPVTTYHYHVVATNGAGTATGRDLTFVTNTGGVTATAPSVTTTAAGAVGQTIASLNG